MEKDIECGVMKWHNHAICCGYSMKYKKWQILSLFTAFSIKCYIIKLMKLLWIILLTLNSGLSNKHGFQIKVENNKISKLNYFECLDY